MILSKPDTTHTKDWHGLNIGETVEKIRKLRGGLNLKRYIPGKIFWQALLQGGVQGGLWVLDTLEAAVNKGNNCREIIRKWKEQ